MAFGLVAYDIIYLIVAATLYGGAAWSGAHAFGALTAWLPWWFALAPAAAVALLALVVEVGALTLLLPRLTAGRYPLMKGRVFWSWLLRSILRRVLLYPPIKVLLFTSNTLRWLSLRALGARVAFTANMSSDVDLLDPPLTTVGPGATLGARCLVAPHYIKGGELFLEPVTVGAGALLAVEVTVAPGATIGREAMVLGRAAVNRGAWIGDGAVVGACAFLEPGAVVAAGARVPANSTVRRLREGDGSGEDAPPIQGGRN